MKASQLIEELRKAVEEHGDHEVLTEGCDCVGDVGSVKVEEYFEGKVKFINLMRPE